MDFSDYDNSIKELNNLYKDTPGVLLIIDDSWFGQEILFFYDKSKLDISQFPDKINNFPIIYREVFDELDKYNSILDRIKKNCNDDSINRKTKGLEFIDMYLSFLEKIINKD